MGVKFSRLFVIIFAILIPIYIAAIFIAYDFQIAWFPWPDVGMILVRYVAPILFSISWGYIMIIYASRIAGTIDILKGSSAVIRPHYFLFYGFTFLTVFFIFIVPILTPVFAFLAFSSMIFRLLTINRNWDVDETPGKALKIISIIAAVPSLLCFLLVAPELFQLAMFLFKTVWNPYIDLLYFLSLALGSAIAIGEFLLLYLLGKDEYDGTTSSQRARDTKMSVFFIEIVYTALFMFFYTKNIELYRYMLYIGTFFAALTFFINFLKGKDREDFRRNIGGYIIYGGLMISNSLFSSNTTMQYLVILITVLIFGGSFTLIFFFHSDFDEDEDE
jgi:hypothetical protein